MTSSQLTEFKLCLHHPQMLMLQGDCIPPRLPGFNSADKVFLLLYHSILLLAHEWLGFSHWYMRIIIEENLPEVFFT